MRAFAVYRLEPIGVNGALEATGVEYWACSNAHARTLASSIQDDYSIGANNDALPGTECAFCGEVIA